MTISAHPLVLQLHYCGSHTQTTQPVTGPGLESVTRDTRGAAELPSPHGKQMVPIQPWDTQDRDWQ